MPRTQMEPSSRWGEILEPMSSTEGQESGEEKIQSGDAAGDVAMFDAAHLAAWR